MNAQRGLGLLGVLIWGALIGGIYYATSVGGLYVDNFTLKNDARAVGNEWLSRSVSDPAILDKRMRDKAAAVGIDPKELKLHITAVEESVTIAVEYRRAWKLKFTDKAYVRRFAWTVKQVR